MDWSVSRNRFGGNSLHGFIGPVERMTCDLGRHRWTHSQLVGMVERRLRDVSREVALLRHFGE
jgi:hypothetical protein